MNPTTSSLLKIIATIICVAIAAQISIDIGAIPITGQTLAILCLAFFLSPKEAIIALSGYLILGIIGLPIFADGTYGIEKLSGGSGGFLIGFLFAASIISYLYQYYSSNSFLTILSLTTFGTIIILSLGVGRLTLLYDFQKALEYGFLPFWSGALMKVFIGTLIVWIIKNKMLSKVKSEK